MTDTSIPTRPSSAEGTVFAVILAVSFCHFINDVMQSLLAALYPMLKDDFHLDFWQIGLLTMAFQVTASLLQPVDRHVYRQAAAALFAAGRHGRLRWSG